ncbi:hypothetical protein TGVAND_214560 [Toxoplasma gondii VAND]|uniref:Chromatin assembly factor 1 subunit A n=1 Tax=Toxoplasma gondii VAND TaxID=933077 RepID=A0A086Q5E3_TOXGO|nr:hypothetical protein TGVAND_214560 [Toxoplasma gondii VAND]
MPARLQGAAPHMLPVAGAPAKSSSPGPDQNAASSLVAHTSDENTNKRNLLAFRAIGENGSCMHKSTSPARKCPPLVTSCPPASALATVADSSPTPGCRNALPSNVCPVVDSAGGCSSPEAAASCLSSGGIKTSDPITASELPSSVGLHTLQAGGMFVHSPAHARVEYASNADIREISSAAVTDLATAADGGGSGESLEAAVPAFPHAFEVAMNDLQDCVRLEDAGNTQEHEESPNHTYPSGVGSEDIQPSSATAGGNRGTNGPRRVAGRGRGGTRSSGAGTGGTTGTKVGVPKPEQDRIRQLYDPLWRESEQELQQVLVQGLPEVDTLTNPQVYLELKQKLLQAPSSPQSSSVDDEDDGSRTDNEDVALSPLKRLLRALCEGSSLPLSALIVEVQRVLRDGTDGSPTEDVADETLRTLLPVLLSRRSLGVPRQRGSGSSPGATAVPPASREASVASASSSPSGACASVTTVNCSSFSSPLIEKNEDLNPSSLWVWESAFLEGLPSAFKEKTRKDREKRMAISRKVRTLVRLQQVIEQGVEKDILATKEKAEALKRKEQQEEEKRREQELRRRRAEEARAEREREKRQREDAKKEKEKEKEKKKQIVEEQKQTPPQRVLQKTEGKKVQKETQAMKGQQNFMVSWLARKPPRISSPSTPFTGSAPVEASGVGKPAEGSCDVQIFSVSRSTGSLAVPSAACDDPIGREKEDQLVEIDDGTLEARKVEEAARARAATEAEIWRVPEGKRSQFIDIVLRLPQPLSPLPASSCDSVPFFDKEESGCDLDAEERLAEFVEEFASPHTTKLREFHTFCAQNRQFVHKLPVQQTQTQLPVPSGTAENSAVLNGWSEHSAPGVRSYQQEMREIKQGLTLTDYTDNSLRDLPYLRTAWVNLDEWKRPVRRLLLGKQAKKSTACEQWAEESCIDYDRDSDEEWFENFDVDDLDEGKDEDEEEELEGEEDKDWLVEDDDEGSGAGRAGFGQSVRFESLCDWHWSFEGEEKPNARDEGVDPCVVNSVRDRNWLSIYGCVVDDWGGKPFEKLEAIVTGTTQRKKMTDEELCSLFKFSHAKKDSKTKLIADFHKLNKHLTKADLERRFKEHIVYERRPEDKQKRWYVSAEATEAFNLKEDLESIAALILSEESSSQSTPAQPSTEAVASANSSDGPRVPNSGNVSTVSQGAESPAVSKSDTSTGVSVAGTGAQGKGGASQRTGAGSGPSVLVQILRQTPEMSAGSAKKPRLQEPSNGEPSNAVSVASRRVSKRDGQEVCSAAAAPSAPVPLAAPSCSRARKEDDGKGANARVAGVLVDKLACETPSDTSNCDPFRDLDPFASATATAMVAAFSAEAAAMTAVEQGCSGVSASAVHVAAAAMAAAALAREMAATMAETHESVGANAMLSCRKALRVAQPENEGAQEDAKESEGSHNAIGPADTCDAGTPTEARRLNSEGCGLCGEDEGATPRQAKNESTRSDAADADDGPVWGKRRRSDGQEEGSCYGSSPGSSVGTTKKVRRGSTGLAATVQPVKCPQLKNTLITQFFRTVPTGDKRSLEGSAETPS